MGYNLFIDPDTASEAELLEWSSCVVSFMLGYSFITGGAAGVNADGAYVYLHLDSGKVMRLTPVSGGGVLIKLATA